MKIYRYEMISRRVLLHEREPGETLWIPRRSHRVLKETNSSALIRLRWWRRPEWVPKLGLFIRCEDIR